MSGAGLLRALSRPWLLWAVAAVFAGRDVLLAALETSRPDTLTFLAAGRAILTDPGSLYVLSARWLQRYHQSPPSGGLLGFIQPAPVAWLLAPLAGLPAPLAVAIWTAADGACLLAGLLLLYREIRPRGVARPVFWLLAAFFPPVFAELDAGQVGGVLLLLCGASIALHRTHAILSGAAAGAAAALKLYPAAMAVGAARGLRLRYLAGAAGAGAGITLLAFAPLGPAALPAYARNVLWYSLTPQNPDCAISSTSSLISRLLGGASWIVPVPGGSETLSMPWAAPAAARVAALAAAVLIVALAALAMRRSGFEPVYSLALAFSLGALVPGEVFPYQLLPMLPVTLVVVTRSVEAGAWRPLAVTASALALFVRPPCDVPLPNLWTIGSLILFGLAVQQAPRFRSPR